MTQWDKYIKICQMARKKYQEPNGTLVVQIGHEPTQYTKVEEFAFDWLVRRNRNLVPA
jgi:hypothetical protein